MSRFLISSTVSYIRVPRPLAQLRMKSSSSAPSDDWFGRKCPKPQENVCEPAISNPESKPVCTTEADQTGRADADFEQCLRDNIANPIPICTKGFFRTFPCETSPIPKNRNRKPKFNGESAWEKVPCCSFHKCKIEPIRHDILYLEPSEKCWRRTYRDWDYVCIVDKVCRAPKFDVDEPEYRPPAVRVRPIEPHCVKPDPCAMDRPRGQVNKAPTAFQPKIKVNTCPKFPRLPGCKPARSDVKCISAVAPSCCQKRCTQYPSFSECAKKTDLVCFPPKQEGECRCITNVTKCQLFQRADWLKN